jgi:allophanate hydrolase subunit 2
MSTRHFSSRTCLLSSLSCLHLYSETAIALLTPRWIDALLDRVVCMFVRVRGKQPRIGMVGRSARVPLILRNMFGTQALLASLSTPFKRSQLGLFHGKMRQSGNNVPIFKAQDEADMAAERPAESGSIRMYWERT